MEEFYTFDQVLQILQVDEEELKRLISQGELRGVREGAQIKFRKADVDRLRWRRESEPTIILTDSDAEMAIPSEDQLMVEEEHERETVAGVEIFETEELPTLLSEDETAAGVPPPAEVGTGEETVMEVQRRPKAARRRPAPAYEPTGTPGEETVVDTRKADVFAGVEEFEMAAPPTRAESGRISRSARLRAMQVKRRKPAILWNCFLLASIVFMALQLPMIATMLRGDVKPDAIQGIVDTFRSVGETLMQMFASQ